MERALVTGAAGHIGRNVAEALLAAGFHVVGLDVREPAPELSRNPAFTAVVNDVRDRPTLLEAARGARAIFHLAMRPFTGVESDAELEALALDGLDAAIAAARGSRARLVFTSSTAAVGETIDPLRPRDETSWNDDPVTPYTRAKVLAERALWRERERSGGALDAVAVLPAMTIGPGDDHLTASNARIVEMMRRARLPLWFGGGTGLADARDVAAGHLLAAERGRPGERYILCAENLTNRELLTRIRRLTGAGGPPAVRVPDTALLAAVAGVERLTRAAGRRPFVTTRQMRHRLDRYAFFDAARARTELGWTPRPVDDTLRDISRTFLYA